MFSGKLSFSQHQKLLPYPIIRSRRKSIAIHIKENGEVVIRAPHFASQSQIENFVQSKSKWIDKHTKKRKELFAQKKEYSLEEITQMKQDLMRYVVPKIEEIWQQSHLPKYTSIKITKSEGRWGSCSGKNGICLSYRLAEYLDSNPEVIDSVIVHELAHLQEKNHQKPFWNLVYSLMPEYDRFHDILKKS